MHKIAKLTISNLIFIIVNNNYDKEIKKQAEEELKKRCQLVGWSYINLIDSEFRKIVERGMDINNYLICPKPSVQLLMELYFTYVYENTNNLLLLSEKHLCSDISYFPNFFDKVCNEEIETIKIRINEEPDLILIKELFEKRAIIKEENKDKIKKKDFYKHNEILYDLDNKKIKIGKRFNEEFLKFIDYNDNNLYNTLCNLHQIHIDSQKLSEQKRIILEALRYGYKVDYNSKNMQKALIRIKNK